MPQMPQGPATAKRSPLFSAARAILIQAERHLPRSFYTLMYQSAFRVYRAGIGAGFRAELRHRRRKGDWAAVQRGEAVMKAWPYSLVGPSGLEATYDAVIDTVGRGVEGAIVECGVAQGGSSAVMALALRDVGVRRHLWLFDSYEGLPEATEGDVDPTSGGTGAHVRPLPKGSCLGTYEEVTYLMKDILRVPPDDFTLVKGWFQDTLPDAARHIGAIAVLRLDGDWYESTRCCLNTLYDQLSPGGVLIIDDYHSCFGAHRAVHEFFAARGDEHPLFTNDGSGGVLYTKA